MRTCIVTFEKLPACVLSCYGSMQNQTPHFDTVAAVGKTYDLFFASETQQTLPGFVDLTNSQTTLLTDISPMQFAGDVKQLVEHKLATFAAADCSEQFQNGASAQFWIHVSKETCSSEEMQLALDAWELEVETFPTEISIDEVGLGLIEQGLTNEQASRVVVSALTIAKDRLLGQIWEAWKALCQPGDRFIVSATHGDHRLAPTGQASWINALSDPLTHLPLIVHRAGEDHPVRDQTLMTSQQFFEDTTFDATANGELQQQIRYESPRSIAHRTRDWMLVEKRPEQKTDDEKSFRTERQFALFRKPEDIWEILNVADQFPDLIEAFQETGRLTKDV